MFILSANWTLVWCSVSVRQLSCREPKTDSGTKLIKYEHSMNLLRIVELIRRVALRHMLLHLLRFYWPHFETHSEHERNQEHISKFPAQSRATGMLKRQDLWLKIYIHFSKENVWHLIYTNYFSNEKTIMIIIITCFYFFFEYFISLIFQKEIEK